MKTTSWMSQGGKCMGLMVGITNRKSQKRMCRGKCIGTVRASYPLRMSYTDF